MSRLTDEVGITYLDLGIIIPKEYIKLGSRGHSSLRWSDPHHIGHNIRLR